MRRRRGANGWVSASLGFMSGSFHHRARVAWHSRRVEASVSHQRGGVHPTLTERSRVLRAHRALRPCVVTPPLRL